jgi:TetR/AcrR family transcriptional regulator
VQDQKSAHKEEAIVAAAHKRFAYYGYSKTTMDEIARDLGMGKASLYYYFPTKESLFRAVIVTEQDQFAARATALIAGTGTATEKMHAYVEKRLDYFQRTVILSKFSTQTYSEIRPVFGSVMQSFARCELRFLRQILESGNRSGEFAVERPEEFARLLLRVLQGLRVLMFKSASDGEPGDKEFETLRQETKGATGIFLRGIRPETKPNSIASTEGKPH